MTGSARQTTSAEPLNRHEAARDPTRGAAESAKVTRTKCDCRREGVSGVRTLADIVQVC